MYCTVKHYIFAASYFFDSGVQKFRCILIWHFPSVLLVFTRPLMGRLNFRGYLISQFYPTREIHKNLMYAENMFCSISAVAQLSSGMYDISPSCLIIVILPFPKDFLWKNVGDPVQPVENVDSQKLEERIMCIRSLHCLCPLSGT